MATIAIEPMEPQTRTFCPSDLQAAITAGYVELARAAVRRAIRDALGKDLSVQLPEGERAAIRAEARRWLASPDGLEFADLAGFDDELIQRWARAGYPSPAEVGER